MPSNAGIVLFGRDRAKHYLDDARWRCIQYPGTAKGTEAIDSRDYEDRTVLEALPAVEQYIQQHSGIYREIEGLDRADRPAFSDRVVREVLVNAVAHANYEVKVPKNPLFSISQEPIEKSEKIEKSEDGRRVPAQQRQERILKALRGYAAEGATPSEISDLVGVSLATMYRDIDALLEHGHVRRIARGRVALTREDDSG